MKAAIQPCAAYVTAENKHFWTVNNISQLEQRQREEQKYRIVICLQNKRSRENWYMEWLMLVSNVRIRLGNTYQKNPCGRVQIQRALAGLLWYVDRLW